MSNKLLLGWLFAVTCSSAFSGCRSSADRPSDGGRGDRGIGTGGGPSNIGSGDSGSPGSGGSLGDGAGDLGGTGGATGATDIPLTTELIDDLDDNDGRILTSGGRQGPWHAFNDQNGGNQQPPVNGPFVPKAGGANGTPYAVHTTGSGYQFGGVGFGLNNPTMTPESAQSQPYDASAFNGITFWAKGSGNVRVELPQRSLVPSDRGGACSSDCWNVYGAALPTPLGGEWQQYTIPFSALERERGGKMPPFNPAELMGVAFKAGGTFDFWIDQVQFTKGGAAGGSGGVSGGSGSGGRGGSGAGGGASGSGSGGRGGSSGSGGNSGSVVHPPPISSGGRNAWASRYWDCCKPACAWRDNAGGQPMPSCNQQNQPLGDANARNACESGGSAYMCWSGVPWSVSDTLAYGFAAASGGNYVCGRCYQLQFTGASHNGSSAGTSALNGKTMIIQVINNGGVAADQFDLLIPGGGVGEFNACSMQWGASNADLGQQYGGLLAACRGDSSCVRQRCQTLFAGKPDLQAGCDWFLGWFNAADNPSVIYKQIACPAAITQRSGLRDPG